ncbi:MAG: GIY-YIG nuclease family protein [Candidatus Pacebacteria bacterium]|nr:GIY-YIG nuclease family protein [Candidatus Paceibacterota bacterium]
MSKTITIFLKDGLSKGIRKVKAEEWRGEAVAAPRNKVEEIFRDVAMQENFCVYFLVGEPDNGELPKIYVGYTGHINNRTHWHLLDKDWWNEIVVFVDRAHPFSETKAHYLESLCYKKLKETGKCLLQNRQEIQAPIGQEYIGGIKTFYKYIELILPLLGVDVLALEIESVPEDYFYCEGNGVKARGVYQKDGKLKVLKGSKATIENVPVFDKRSYKRLKDELIGTGRLKKEGDFLIFTKDYTFNSPSAAANVVLGSIISGYIAWKREQDSKTIKDILKNE